MTRRCTICMHSQRLQIDKAVIRGETYQMISNTYDVDWQAVRRHEKNGHISHQLETAMNEVEKQEALDLYSELQGLVDRTKAILDTAEAKNQNSLALEAIRELRSNFSLIAQMLAAEKITEPDDAVQVHSLEEFLNHFLDANLQYLSSGEIMQMQKLFEKMQNRTKSRREVEHDAQIKAFLKEDADYSTMKRSKPRPSEQRKSDTASQSVSQHTSNDDDEKDHSDKSDLLKPQEIPGSRHSRLIRRAIARKIDRQNRES